jgi:hypothetical protein
MMSLAPHPGIAAAKHGNPFLTGIGEAHPSLPQLKKIINFRVIFEFNNCPPNFVIV